VSKRSLRIIFAGTPEFAASHLKALLGSVHQVVAVYTQPDRPAGRGRKLSASPVKKLAEASGIPVLQPPSLKNEQAQQALANIGADLMIVVAYGLILPREVLDAPAMGCLNVHASLLPRWRGAAPIQRAIEAGDSESGITIMQMDEGLDTGDMLASTRCPIDENTTAASLHDDLAVAGAPLLLNVLDTLPEHLAAGREQDDEQATYAAKISKAEAEIDWHEDAGMLARKIRAFNPFPISYTFSGQERIKVHAATACHDEAATIPPGTIVSTGPEGVFVACGSGQLCMERLQIPGGKALAAGQLLTSRHAPLLATGVSLGRDVPYTDPA